MKKIFIVIFMICSIICYSQEWTNRDDYNGVDHIYTVISKVEYESLLKAYEAKYKYCMLSPAMLLMRSRDLIREGNRGADGYFYLKIRLKALEGYGKTREEINYTNDSVMLMKGHTEIDTGVILFFLDLEHEVLTTLVRSKLYRERKEEIMDLLEKSIESNRRSEKLLKEFEMREKARHGL